MANCTGKYYFPEEDKTKTIECTTTKCTSYKTTDFGFECVDTWKEVLVYLSIFIVCGIFYGLCYCSREYPNGCCNSNSNSGYKPINNAKGKSYVENDDNKVVENDEDSKAQETF